MKIVGIDLAGSEKRPTGFCLLNQRLECKSWVLYSDKQILQEVFRAKPKIVSIDAPLCLPKGRKSLSQRGPPHLRKCDKELLERGIKFFPVTLGPMRKLTARGIKLKKILERKGFKVIETFPGAAQDLLGLPRKQHGIEKLRKGLQRLGIKGISKKMGGDELDAITCALVGLLFLKGEYQALGDSEEILMILPKNLSKLRKA